MRLQRTGSRTTGVGGSPSHCFLTSISFLKTCCLRWRVKMYHCRFRALTELGDPFYFSVADVPVKVYPDMFILAARSGTPILRASTIGRAMDHMQLAEGDQVLIDGKRYILGITAGSPSGAIVALSYPLMLWSRTSSCRWTLVRSPSSNLSTEIPCFNFPPYSVRRGQSRTVHWMYAS